jgi:hypothetical protein
MIMQTMRFSQTKGIMTRIPDKQNTFLFFEYRHGSIHGAVHAYTHLTDQN